jgi:peptidoglycan/xylan/chitin deacetylase (PgdA/CDA1 family)
VPFPHDGRPVSWTGLRDAVTTGLVEIGSHTDRHLLLDRADRAEAEADLDRSIALIGERVGVGPRHFAYPKAVVAAPAVEDAVRARFASAALAGTRPNRYGCTDRYRIARSPIQRRDGMVWFRRKLAGGLGLEDALRETANRRRYAGRTT